MWFANFFLPFCVLFLHPWWRPLWSKSFQFDEGQFIGGFSLMGHVFVMLSKNSYQALYTKGLPCFFPPKNFVVLYLRL